MPGLVPGIHDLRQQKTWIAGTSPAMTQQNHPNSGGLGAVSRPRHALEDFAPVLGVLDGVAHQQQEGLFLEIAPPAFASVKLDVMAAATFGERMPFAHRLDRPTKRSVPHASGSQNAQNLRAPGTRPQRTATNAPQTERLKLEQT